jgi:hypothetical protein
MWQDKARAMENTVERNMREAAEFRRTFLATKNEFGGY